MKQPCVTKLIASLPQELSCFADRTNTGKLYTPFARRINSSADVTGTWENDHQKKEISKQNWNITNQNQRALHHARWGASSDQVRWAAQGCDPLRAKSSIQENRGQEPSDGGGGRAGNVRSSFTEPLGSLGLCSCNRKVSGSPCSQRALAWLLAPACPTQPTLHTAPPSATLMGGKCPSGWGCCGNSACLHQTCGCKSHIRDSATAGTVAGFFQVGGKLSLLGGILRQDAE